MSSPPKYNELLQKFEAEENSPIGEKLLFEGVGKNDVYNISAPFHIGDKIVIAGRVEAREARADSHVVFFEEGKDAWVPTSNAPSFKLEDGFATHIGDEIVFGGVEVYPNYTVTDPQGVGYRTIFYRGHNLVSLRKFAEGPDMMKDIRLVQLANGKLGVFTRPQGRPNGRGKIGYIELANLENLNEESILKARIIENQFVPEEWGGVNELHVLENGAIGVLGHIACMDAQGHKHYAAMSFIYNPIKHRASPINIIATRKNFPPGICKRPELADVIFSGGLVRHGDGTATLYAGLSDAEAGKVTIPNPFSQ